MCVWAPVWRAASITYEDPKRVPLPSALPWALALFAPLPLPLTFPVPLLWPVPELPENVVGMMFSPAGPDRVQDARDVLTAAGIINPVLQFSSTVPANVVITTDPAPGTEQPAGSTITLVISEGPAAVVPGVVLRTQGAAIALIRAAQLNPVVNPVTIPGYLPDFVTSQSLAAGTQVKRGTTVVISVEQPSSTTTTTTFSPVP
jgi:serine/threonine-protein kinase